MSSIAVRRVRELAPPGAKIEVECDSLDQVRAAIDAGADEVLVDNMPVDTIREAVDDRAWTRDGRSVRWRDDRHRARDRGDGRRLHLGRRAHAFAAGHEPRAGLRLGGLSGDHGVGLAVHSIRHCLTTHAESVRSTENVYPPVL